MSNYDQTGAEAETFAAVFNDREAAHEALANLRDAGFHHAWVGVTSTDTGADGEPTLENAGPGGFIESVGRFFSGEGFEGKALHAALVQHGLSEQQARRIDATIVPGNAIVTVDGNDDPVRAVRILRQSGGRLEGSSASSASRSNDTIGQGATLEQRGIRAGEPIDDPARRERTRVEETGIDPNVAGLAGDDTLPRSA